MTTLQDFVLAIALVVGVLVLPAIAILRVRDRIGNARTGRWLRRHPERDPGSPEYAVRLASPDLDAMQSRFGAPLPGEYLRLYADSGLLSAGILHVRPSSGPDDDVLDLNGFLPADQLAVGEAWESIPSNGLPFASDSWGNTYYIAPDRASRSGHAVFLYLHDGDEHLRVAESLTAFLAGLQPSPDAAQPDGHG